MAESFRTRRRVEFRDTDAAGIVHFSVFFAYMEQAEHEMLRGLGLSVVDQFDGRWISWPRVRAACDFRKPARFEDELEIEVQVRRIGQRSVTYGFVFRGAEGIVAEGEVTAACCETENRQIKGSVPIPEAVRPADAAASQRGEVDVGLPGRADAAAGDGNRPLAASRDARCRLRTS